jgi:hypothetical protein
MEIEYSRPPNNFCTDCTTQGLCCEECLELPDLIEIEDSNYEPSNHINNNINTYNNYNNYYNYIINNNIINNNIINNEYINNIRNYSNDNENDFEYNIYRTNIRQELSSVIRVLFQDDVSNIELRSVPIEHTEPTFDCAICLDNHSNTVALTLECGHKFCANSLCSNLRRSNTCPLCRKDIRNMSLSRVSDDKLRLEIHSHVSESKCTSCENSSHCEADCGHKYCGNCIVSHLHTSNKSECQECNLEIKCIRI